MSESVVNPPEGFITVPVEWMFNLTGEEMRRMCILRWRYTFFADMARKADPDADVTRVFWESQQALCQLLGFAKTSRTKCGLFLKKMEEKGLLTIIREEVVVGARLMPRHYISVNDPFIKERYENA